MKLLLDAHIDPAVARGLAARVAIDVISLRDWHDREYLNADDEPILRAAAAEGRTLVTYDQQTIPDLLSAWGEQGIPHSGVIFVDNRTIAQGDVGGLIRALVDIIDELGDVDWENRIAFLHP